MTYILFSNDYYFITLEITRDFIADDYDSFINNNSKDDTKIIKWEMLIQFKKLNDNQPFEIIQYNLGQAKTWLEKIQQYDFYPNTYNFTTNYQTLNQFQSICAMDSSNYFITSDVSYKYYPSSISVIFYCNEEKKTSVNQNVSVNYVHRFDFIIQAILSVLNNLDYYNFKSHNQKVIFDSVYKFNDIKTKDTLKNKEIKNVLTEIAIDHWKEIKNNIEAYSLYCKTQQKDVDYVKIVKSIDFIKEYVKKVYDYVLF